MANGTSHPVSAARINREFAERIGGPYGLEGLALMVPSCLPDPEVYLESALPHYGLAPTAGEMNEDAVALLVCETPRFVGLYYASGNPHAARLDERAVTGAMRQHLQAGDYTGAITVGFDSIADALSGISATVPPEGGTPGVTSRSTRAGALGLVALLAVGAGALVLRRRSVRGTGAAAPRAAGPEARLRQMMAELEHDLLPSSPALAHLVLAYETLGDEAVLELNRRHQSMLDRLAELQRQVDGLFGGVVSEAMAEDPTALAARYERPLAEAGALLAYVHGLDAESKHVAMLLERAPVLAVEAREAIDEGRTRYVAEAEPALPPVDQLFRWPEALVDGAEQSLTAGDRISAGRLAETARAAAQLLGEIPAGLHDGARMIEKARDAFGRIDDHAQSSWADIRGNGSEAEESLATVRDQLARIAAAAPAEFGADLGAGLLASLDRVRLEIARAGELSDAVIARLAAIEKARSDSVAALAAVQRELSEARSWLAQPSVDIDVDAGPAADLDRIEAELHGVEAAMTQTAPDWPAVLRSIGEADRMVDAALSRAREQQARIAALERQRGTIGREAEAAVDRAERFLGAHHGDVTAASRSALDSARTALRDARDAERAAGSSEDQARMSALMAAIDGLARARDVADSAFEAMSRDFEAAEARRRPHVPRPEWAGPAVPVPMGLPPFGGPFGGRPHATPVPHPPSPGRWGAPTGEPRPSSGGGTTPASSSRRGGGQGW